MAYVHETTTTLSFRLTEANVLLVHVLLTPKSATMKDLIRFDTDKPNDKTEEIIMNWGNDRRKLYNRLARINFLKKKQNSIYLGT